MRKTSLAVTALLAAAAIAWAGGDPWKTKSVDQWTEKDITEILQTSPWAKADQATRRRAARRYVANQRQSERSRAEARISRT